MRARTYEFFENGRLVGERVLTKEFWSGSIREQNWDFGDFEVIDRPISVYDDGLIDPTMKPGGSGLGKSQSWEAHGVEWSKEDAEAMGANFDAAPGPALVGMSPADDKIAPAVKGRPISELWPLWVAELVLWVEEADEDAAGLTSGKLIEKINDRLAKKGIDQMPRSTAEDTAKEVLRALCSDK